MYNALRNIFSKKLNVNQEQSKRQIIKIVSDKSFKETNEHKRIIKDLSGPWGRKQS